MFLLAYCNQFNHRKWDSLSLATIFSRLLYKGVVRNQRLRALVLTLFKLFICVLQQAGLVLAQKYKNTHITSVILGDFKAEAPTPPLSNRVPLAITLIQNLAAIDVLKPNPV